MRAGFYIDYYDDLFIVYPDDSAEIWTDVFGWVKTTKMNISGSWKLIELLYSK